MKKLKKIIILIIIIIAIIIIYSVIYNLNEEKEKEIIQISSQKELEEIYDQDVSNEYSVILKLIKLPFSLIKDDYNSRNYISKSYIINNSNLKGVIPQDLSVSNTETSKSETTKEYSTTNIQVENVDEADITKTDGDYIYSLSENEVIITDVRNPEEIKVVKKISESSSSNTIPEDLILNNNKLIVIYEKMKSSFSYNSGNTTYVGVYDVSSKEKPKKIKNYEIQQPYYTSRCIEGKLYVIASGSLKKENDEIVTYYKEDEKKIDPGFSSISRIKDLNTDSETILSMIDLNDIDKPVKINSYLMNVENAYISENNIYLLDERYKGDYYKKSEILDIFGLKGILGFTNYDYYDYEKSETYTEIYKFNILEDGSIKFDKKAEEKGTTINQFSIDEYEGNLRLALYENQGSRVVVFNNEMKKIGESEKLAEGEKIYSSRFIGNKAYLVTYKTIDPLFVIDLSNPSNPEVLGELKIPGYSTYLHPYDENHIIGIGMQTEEHVNRNSNGKILSTTATITGMKMALFDVTDVNNPIQISDTVIGDRRATSAILTNHKALLFSKEKQLIAIPVNNYNEDFEIDSSENYNSMINSYTNYDKEYISEGYFVYNLNLIDGFKLKGTITHNKTKSKYSYYKNSRLLRGLYIDNNLYTISEDYIKVNQLEDLKEINQLKIKED